ncbi:hypothetical protein ERO13_D02G075666v2 [Gossypium hirsutum]|nr:hypothetical protein ERO13_D02G075666v2 [Gossypium hirsutum]
MGTNPSPRVAIALDATKDLNQRELSATISNVRARGDILVNGDTLVVLGILAKVTLPLGYQSKASLLSTSETSIRAMHEEISKKVDTYVRMLQQSAQDCERQGVRVEVKIIGGASTKDIVIKEAASCKAVILDRKLRQDLQFYLDKIPCKEVTSFQDSIVLEILRADAQREADITAIKKLFYIYYKARPVLQSNFQANNTNGISSLLIFHINPFLIILSESQNDKNDIRSITPNVYPQNISSIILILSFHQFNNHFQFELNMT